MDFFHVMNRGVDKRDVVMDDFDRARFIHDLYVLNDSEPVINFLHHGRSGTVPVQKKSSLVHIHAFALMNNHYHLLLTEVVENGIPLFMKKLNMGYSKYFNEKYERSGALWQGKYKKVPIQHDAHFLYIPFYIHLNPLDYTMPEWRSGSVRDVKKAMTLLSEYRWSSHLDYLGIQNFPSIIHQQELSPILGLREEYENTIAHIISDPFLAEISLTLE